MVRIPLPDGEVVELFRGWLSPEDANRLLAALLAELPWCQGSVRMFGRLVPEPRLSAWIAGQGLDYRYSGVHRAAADWTPASSELRDRVVEATGIGFNSVLCNHYRDGQDCMGMHHDAEPELGPDPWIASVSLGAPRLFQLRRETEPAGRLDLELCHGDLLVIPGAVQRRWKHGVPRTRKPSVGWPAGRVNMTFRRIIRRSSPS